MKNLVICSCIITMSYSLVGCSNEPTTKNEYKYNELDKNSQDEIYINGSEANSDVVRLATTTSIDNTGILQELVADFEKTTNYSIEYVAVGSGSAMEMGRNGDVDAVFVHSESEEQQLVADNISLGRNPLMYNYFQFVGYEPLDSTEYEDVIEEIRNSKLFISRGDNSGTHVRELELWEGKLPKEYLETGVGMLDTLVITSELEGYTFTDTATYITNNDKFNLVECYTDKDFKNIYSYHIINPELNDYINYEGAKAFLDYLKSKEAQELISVYGLGEYNVPLYELMN